MCESLLPHLKLNLAINPENPKVLKIPPKWAFFTYFLTFESRYGKIAPREPAQTYNFLKGICLPFKVTLKLSLLPGSVANVDFWDIIGHETGQRS